MMKKLIYLYLAVLGLGVVQNLYHLLTTHYVVFNALVFTNLLMQVAYLALCVYVFVAWYRRSANVISLTKLQIYYHLVLFVSWLMTVFMLDLSPKVYAWCVNVIPAVVEIFTLVGLYCSSELKAIFPPKQRRLLLGDKIAISSVIVVLFGLIVYSAIAEDTDTQPKEPVTITQIEDKPGPTMQGRDVFPTVPDSIWESLGLQDGVPSSMSCFLMQVNEEYVLFDAGLGAPFSQLLPRLSEMGIAPEDIPYIYITHMHADHIGGLVHDGAAVFPNAELYVNRLEAEAWLAMPDGKAAQAQAVLEAYSGHVHLFETGDELPLGVKTIAAFGHTPGHTCFEKDSILVIADILHGAALQLEHPEYCSFFDMDPEAATASRIRILEYGREHGLKMYGHHLPVPGYIE